MTDYDYIKEAKEFYDANPKGSEGQNHFDDYNDYFFVLCGSNGSSRCSGACGDK